MFSFSIGNANSFVFGPNNQIGKNKEWKRKKPETERKFSSKGLVQIYLFSFFFHLLIIVISRISILILSNGWEKTNACGRDSALISFPHLFRRKFKIILIPTINFVEVQKRNDFCWFFFFSFLLKFVGRRSIIIVCLDFSS